MNFERFVVHAQSLSFLNRDPHIARLSPQLRARIDQLTEERQIALKQLMILNLAPIHEWEMPTEKHLEVLADQLVDVNRCYREIGGIAGYQQQVMHLLSQKNAHHAGEQLHPPFLVDISQKTREVEQAIDAGVLALPLLAELLPLGGAADRLHLVDQETGEELPAAKLKFAGHSLLATILRDLTAWERLYTQRTQKSIVTPIVMMTSREKNNWHHIQEILETHRWFGRPKESFRSFIQPLVPVVDPSGSWCWHAPWKLQVKPGGHGVLWKLARDHGIFDWLYSLGIKYALIRQINNPLAGLDYGLLAMAGIGVQRGMSFGLSSCSRQPGAAEGINVLRAYGTSYAVSNIESCNFAKYDIDANRFTANTNILFAHLADIEQAVQTCPFPGLLLNFREERGRLESTMQNISDAFLEQHAQFPQKGLRKVFITYNHRHKTISTAKKAARCEHPLHETPERCFYDLMQAHRELLTECNFILPPENTIEETLATHPSFVFLFHPALGPQFSTIAEKIQKGELKGGAEWLLEIAEAKIQKIVIEGSLLICANAPLLAKCTLRNVYVCNRGVNWKESQPFWKMQNKRIEAVHIELKGRSEFVAEDLVWEGGQRFQVGDGERLIVTQKGILKETLY
jgi:UTP---glucose-1-phosphate uridylyltransferase